MCSRWGRLTFNLHLDLGAFFPVLVEEADLVAVLSLAFLVDDHVGLLLLVIFALAGPSILAARKVVGLTSILLALIATCH